ncbi:MAG TPA: hypothetical protein EYG03_24210 [Planctomycetes bacterium]|nr:hypothetical protein [Fuerstiella sp.]HIK95060.1 hypothetical protein [Planctomycetota bacterium]
MKFTSCFCLMFVLLVAGCSEQSANSPSQSESPTPETVPTGQPTVAATRSESAVEPVVTQEPMEFKPLSGAVSTSDGAVKSSSESAAVQLSAEQKISVIMAKLKPLQVMLGAWRGTTRREYDGFKAVDVHEWVWDLRSQLNQPALASASDRSPYLKQASLTWNPTDSVFELTATDLNGLQRTFTGDYTDPVHEIVGPDDKLHRVFRLELTQTDESAKQAGGDRWQVSFAQQENNRYLLEVDKRRGTAAFRRFDTVSTQREGTSFALSDSSYGEKECIISQGLGTTSVSWKGKSYWVCCSGCKAAFEEDPETWIARAEKRKNEQK